MSGETRLPHAEAQDIALEVYHLFLGGASKDRIEIAGSLRRGKPYVGDIELVLVPTPATYRVTEELITWKDIDKARYKGATRWGNKLRALNFRGVTVELYLAEPESFGYILWLRTGPVEDNKALMRKLNKTSLRAIDGAIWHAEDWQREQRGQEVHWVSETRRRVVVPDELSWFRLLGVPYVLPVLRKEGVYNKTELKVDLGAVKLLDPAPIQGSLF